MAFGAVSVLNLAIMSNNVAGRTKQVIASSLVFVAWAVGNAVGPQVFRSNDSPRYIKAFIAHLVVYCVQLAALFFLRLYLMRLNVLKRRATALRESSSSGEERVSPLASSFVAVLATLSGARVCRASNSLTRTPSMTLLTRKTLTSDIRTRWSMSYLRRVTSGPFSVGVLVVRGRCSTTWMDGIFVTTH